MLIFRKILRMYQIDGPFGKPKNRTQPSAFHKEFPEMFKLLLLETLPNSRFFFNISFCS